MSYLLIIFVAFLPAYLRFSMNPDDHPVTSSNLRLCYEFRGTKIMEIESTFDHHLGKRLCCGHIINCEIRQCDFTHAKPRYFLSIDSLCYTPFIDGILVTLLILGFVFSTTTIYISTRQ